MYGSISMPAAYTLKDYRKPICSDPWLGTCTDFLLKLAGQTTASYVSLNGVLSRREPSRAGG